MPTTERSPLAFIGRETQLNLLRRRIEERQSRNLISVHGPGGTGKTYLLRKIYEEYAPRSEYFCFSVIDFYQIENRNRVWVLDVVAHQAPEGFRHYFEVYRQFAQQDSSASTHLVTIADVVQAFYDDLLRFEQKHRCIFLYDTIELIQETILLDLLDMMKIAQRSIFILAGRRNAEIESQFAHEFGIHNLLPIHLEGFSEQDAMTYIQQIPAGRDLTSDEQRTLYLLADSGIPIKLALALDWLSRGLVMEALIENTYQDLVALRERDHAAFRKKLLAFERELVTQIGRLGTLLDRSVYIMAHVSKRFNQELLQRLVQPDNTEQLIAQIRDLPFVKVIGDDYFVLHDEVQRMIVRHIWDWEDPTHEKRHELSRQVVQYYDEQLSRWSEIAPAGERSSQSNRSEIWIVQIERLHYQLDVNLADGYHAFREIFDELKDRRDPGDIDLAALALDVLIKERSLPTRLYDFVTTYYRGWVMTRRPNYLDQARVGINDGLKKLTTTPHGEEGVSERRLFLEQEVDQRIGEVYTLLGYNHRMAGNWTEAIQCYDRARELNEQLIDMIQNNANLDQKLLRHSVSRLAETLNDIANLQRMQGELNDARLYCKTSLLLRKSLHEWRTVGHCCYVMSMVMWESGNTSEAMNYLQQARSYYQKTDTEQLHRAWIDRYAGYMMYRTGNIHEAVTLLKRALEAVSSNRNLSEEHAQILLYFSRINRDKGTPADLTQSLKEAETALAIAQNASNEYIIAECYLTLCLTLRAMLKHDPENPDLHIRFTDYFEQGQQIANERKYGRLQNLYITVKADRAFEQRDYMRAFEEYLSTCQRALQFKPSAFGRTLSNLIGRLYELVDEDPDRTLSVCRLIREHWQDLEPDLDENYAGMIQEVEYVNTIASNARKRRRLALTFEHEFRHGSWQRALQACDEADDIPIYQHLNRADVLHRRAEVYHGSNQFSLARLYCERALRIRETFNAPLSDLGDSTLLLSRICWKLGMTAESAAYLKRAEEHYQQGESDVGMGQVHFEKASIYFRTHQFDQASEHLAQAQEIFVKTGEDIQLARTLNVISRLARVDPRQPQYEEIRYDEAQRRGEEALQILSDRDWFVAAELNLTLCILHYVWGLKLQRTGRDELAHQHFHTAREHNQQGWERIAHMDSPMLSSIYHGMQANLFLVDKDWEHARRYFLEELVFATRTKHMRLMRALDLLEDFLVSNPPEQAREHANWLISEWRARNLSEKYPQVEKAIQWIMDHQRYMLQPVPAGEGGA